MKYARGLQIHMPHVCVSYVDPHLQLMFFIFPINYIKWGYIAFYIPLHISRNENNMKDHLSVI